MDIESTEIIELKNGLILELMDQSRKIAGDRWVVTFAARVALTITPDLLQEYDISEHTLKGVRISADETACYHYRDKRNFVPEAEKESVLRELRERFLDTNLKYLSSPNFPAKLILSQLKTRP